MFNFFHFLEHNFLFLHIFLHQLALLLFVMWASGLHWPWFPLNSLRSLLYQHFFFSWILILNRNKLSQSNDLALIRFDRNIIFIPMILHLYNILLYYNSETLDEILHKGLFCCLFFNYCEIILLIFLWFQTIF